MHIGRKHKDETWTVIY